MTLEGVPDPNQPANEGQQLRAGPGLAEILQKQGTNSENADILNLFLNNTTLAGGAPAPITDNVGPIDIPPTFVFNSAFTRERYGEAAVNDTITLLSDRISLLLDSNQTEKQKALAFISSLKLSNGLEAVQAMSNSEVTSRTQPDLDKLTSYPEALFNNAAQLNDAKEDFVFDAVAASDDATEAFTSYQ